MKTTSIPLSALVLLSLVALLTISGSFFADWNATHIYNPLWPPHAKFHNAQTMSLGVCLGIAGLFFVWRRKGDLRSNMIAANIFLTVYWLTQVTAFFFPGTAWTDPNLLRPGHSMREIPPQAYAIAASLAAVFVANLLVFRARGPRQNQ
ncbi:DUF6640 family protein [Rhizobium sp. CCGE 510]|uniref:DUF6640 family protein n=1 Tax=Rhizobium sp. CCGE 510 TaxID=1132836 RepID=UPI00027B8A37|nr:DUF6640 family protein [Rhizobium sp. CCGE 510]EJT05879.1 hypothetical protein RCCGE510_08121 [Rhizobium sp. CCGE 510]